MLSELKKLNLNGTSRFRTVDDRYKLLADIGSGRFGHVHLAFDTRTESFVALKELKDADSLSSLENFLFEIESLVAVKRANACSNVTSILSFGFSPEFGAYYTTSFVGLSNFFEFLEAGGDLSEDMARFFFGQLLECVSKLHQLGLAHLDIKPENILISEDLQLFICDFGSAKKLSEKLDEMLNLSQEYSAPEMYEREELALLCKGEKGLDFRRMDSFALGVVLFVMLFKSNPFRKADKSDPYYHKLMTDPSGFWKIFNSIRTISHDLLNLLEELLTSPASKRPLPQQLLKYSWVNNHGEGFSIDKGVNKNLIIHFQQRARMIIQQFEERKKRSAIEKGVKNSKDGSEIMRRFIRLNEKKIAKIRKLMSVERTSSSDSGSASSEELTPK